MSDIANTGIGAAVILIIGAIVRWLQQRPVKAARRRADQAATAAAAGEQAAVGAIQQATEARADAVLAQQKAQVGGMSDADVDADALRRIERERARRALSGKP